MNTKQIRLKFIMESATVLIVLDDRQICPLFLWETLYLCKLFTMGQLVSLLSIFTEMRQTHRDLAANVPPVHYLPPMQDYGKRMIGTDKAPDALTYLTQIT